MLSRRGPLALFFVVALGLAPSPRAAEASTVVPVTLETLAHRADEILVVTPRHATAQWIGNVIDTDYDLEVQSVVRGSVGVGAHVTLRAPGGIVGGIGQDVPGVPALEINRPYVIFLTRSSDVPGVFYFAHLTAAVLPVTTASDGTITALPATEGMRVRTTAAPSAAPTSSEVTMMPREGMALETLVRALRATR